MTDKQTNMPEAVASVTYSLVTPNGFPILFTVRDDTGSGLLTKMGTIEQTLKIDGYTAQPLRQSGFVKPEKQFTGDPCPLCGKRLYISKMKNGTELIKCEDNKWNPQTKQPEGCAYVKWPQPQQI